MFRYFKLSLALFRYSITRELMFKANFFAWVLVELSWFGIQLALVEVIFSHVQEVAGWVSRHRTQTRLLWQSAFPKDLAELEQRLGHTFATPDFARQALTHRSFGTPHNERLEFLGDSILNCAVATLLYERFPQLPEGDQAVAGRRGHDEGDRGPAPAARTGRAPARSWRGACGRCGQVLLEQRGPGRPALRLRPAFPTSLRG